MRKKRVTQKMIDSFIERELKVIKSDIPDDDAYIYVSKLDESYVTRISMADNLKWMIEAGKEFGKYPLDL